MTTAAQQTSRHTVWQSPIGPLTMVRDDDGLSGLYFPGHWTDPDQSGWGPRVETSAEHGFDESITQLEEYFAGERTTFDVRLAARGSSTAHRVWDLLLEIPYGATTTYGTIAGTIGGGISARAVGGFVGHNPISILVPCHRVVGSTGKLTGYAGGLERKQFLLELENAIPKSAPGLW